MEYMRYLLDNYDQKWNYKMTKEIKETSVEYLCENDGLGKFVEENLEKSKEGYITLKDIKNLLKQCDYFEHKGNTLKTRLERVLGVQCLERKRVGNTLLRSVYDGYILKERDYIDE
jgi:hypothetical protein